MFELRLNVGERIRSRSDTYYSVLQQVGSGGNSIVYLVICLSKRNRGVLFALKIFTRITNQDRIDRFFVETEFLRNDCNHPSIMRIYDEGQLKLKDGDKEVNYPFVIAEYLPDTLRNILYRQFDMVDRVSSCLQLLSALCYLDSLPEKVIHRDIKPQNIFIKGKSCVLGDFGLMKFISDGSSIDKEIYREATNHGMPFYYRSPDLVEYAKGSAELTTKSDIFQLGLVFAEMFTGKNPEIPAQQITDEVKIDELGSIACTKGNQISKLINSMLELNPENRPAALELIDTWDGLFREIADLSFQLNGRIFL